MGVDDEYRAVAEEDSNEHLLEKSSPITRSAYKKRSMAASVIVGALVGAAVMFIFSFFFTTPVSKSKAASAAATLPTATVTATATTTLRPASPTNIIDDDTKSSSKSSKGEIASCGSTPSEARAAGCIFDVMMQLWTPPACMDTTLSERYLAGGNWTWYADVSGENTLTLDQMRLGEHEVIYVIQDYHKQHCIFAWEKAVRALRNDEPLIEELISYDHILHCKMRTLGKEDPSVRGVRAPTGYTRCAMYDTWNRPENMPENKHSSVDK